METVYIIDACRSPYGKLNGTLAHIRPDDLLAQVMQQLLRRNGTIPHDTIDEVIIGCANQAGEDNRNIARIASLIAGLPVSVPGVTVNRLCASGMQAVADAFLMIGSGNADIVLAGGVESMTRAPYAMLKPQYAPKGKPELADTALGWRFPSPAFTHQYNTLEMGLTAEVVAEQFGISRGAQDDFALASHRKYFAALEAGRYDNEIVPVQVPSGKNGFITVDKDEAPRPDTSAEKLAALKTAFKQEGTVTAGNAAGLNDGAAVLLIASEKAVKQYGLTPLAKIRSFGMAGVHPDIMGIGPVPAGRKALSKAALQPGDIDLAEINEAFAAQVLASKKELGIDGAKLNVDGGALAIGHPLGSSGARITGHLAHQLQQRGGRYGLAAMCVGVGQGAAIILESVHHNN